MAKESKPKAAPKKTTTKSASAAAAKKTTTKTAAAKHAAPKAAPPKAAAKSKKQTQFGGGGAPPMVDTNFAAEAAARMIAGRARLAKSGPQAQPAAESDRESGSFKQMKESINKPAAGGMAAAMGNTFGPNKSNLPNPDKGHVVRDQTSSNVNRVNVPRRTAG